MQISSHKYKFQMRPNCMHLCRLEEEFQEWIFILSFIENAPKLVWIQFPFERYLILQHLHCLEFQNQVFLKKMSKERLRNGKILLVQILNLHFLSSCNTSICAYMCMQSSNPVLQLFNVKLSVCLFVFSIQGVFCGW